MTCQVQKQVVDLLSIVTHLSLLLFIIHKIAEYREPEVMNALGLLFQVEFEASLYIVIYSQVLMPTFPG